MCGLSVYNGLGKLHLMEGTCRKELLVRQLSWFFKIWIDTCKLGFTKPATAPNIHFYWPHLLDQTIISSEAVHQTAQTFSFKDTWYFQYSHSVLSSLLKLRPFFYFLRDVFLVLVSFTDYLRGGLIREAGLKSGSSLAWNAEVDLNLIAHRCRLSAEKVWRKKLCL